MYGAMPITPHCPVTDLPCCSGCDRLALCRERLWADLGRPEDAFTTILMEEIERVFAPRAQGDGDPTPVTDRDPGDEA